MTSQAEDSGARIQVIFRTMKVDLFMLMHSMRFRDGMGFNKIQALLVQNTFHLHGKAYQQQQRLC